MAWPGPVGRIAAWPRRSRPEKDGSAASGASASSGRRPGLPHCARGDRGGFLAAIVHVWACALTGRRDPWLRVAVAALTLEGAVVTANGGDCPLGPLQDRLDDPVPLFELVLSPRAAKRAVPVLGAVAAAGIALLARRSR